MVLFTTKYRYAELKWPEIKEYSKQNRVAIVPVGMIEDHGPHLPVDSDALTVEEICVRVARTIPEEVVLLPTLQYGYSPHHMDFPGAITIRGNILTEFVMDICRSLVRHDFRRILIVNGHGSNICFLEAAARMTIIENPNSLCALVTWSDTSEFRTAFEKVRESEAGGVSHACELETSVYLYLKPELVDMGKAVKDISFPRSDHFWFDIDPGPVKMMEYWSTLSKTGIMGDPTKATAKKGEIAVNSAVDGLVQVVRELRSRPIRERVDHH